MGLNFHRKQTYSSPVQKKTTRLDLIKYAIRSFVYTKQRMNQYHEYAVMILTTEATWNTDFTTDLELLMKKVNSLQPMGEFPEFNLGSIFQVMEQKFPQILALSESDPPEFIYRIILLYSRSSTIPTVSPDAAHLVEIMLKSSILFLDAIYLHAKASADHRPQEVYDALTKFEEISSGGYFFENSVNLKRFTQGFATLLANPLQRPKQDSWLSFLEPPSSPGNK